MATRLYLPSSGTPDITPTDDAKWDGLADGFGTWPTDTLPAGSTMTTISLDGNSDTADADFTRTGNIGGSTDYKNGSNVIACRIYQLGP